MRTLVVSDLHLGAAGGRARLEEEESLARLLTAVADTERLILLGDVIELREGPVRRALMAALPVLRRLGEALPPDGEAVLLAGNHDHHLLDPWAIRRQADGQPEPLALSEPVDAREGEPLAAMLDALGAAGARAEARYPGLWLREDVYATHGHYLDCHTTVPLLERISAGVNARVLGGSLDALRAPDDYEAVLAPSYAWIHAIAQTRLTGAERSADVDASTRLWQALGGGRRDGVRGRAIAAGLSGGMYALGRAGLGRLRADLSGAELRRASLAAFGRALGALSVDCRYAIFGHSHRAGPLEGDALKEWIAPTGAGIVNSGCWVHEPAFLGPDPPTSPYRAGFAIELDDDDAPPRLLNLLDP